MNIPMVLLAADNDRDMLEYLHDAFQAEVSVCDQCGYEEPTSTCDSASDLKEYLDRFPIPPQPIYDEAIVEVIESAIFRLETFIAAEREMPIPSMEVLLDAFKRVSQSRAKSVEVGNE